MDLYRLRSLMFGQARCGREARGSPLHYLRLNPDSLSTSFRRRLSKRALLPLLQRPDIDHPQEPIEPMP